MTKQTNNLFSLIKFKKPNKSKISKIKKNKTHKKKKNSLIMTNLSILHLIIRYFCLKS